MAAREQVLSRSGKEVTLGTLLRSSREDVGLSTAAVSSWVRERGVVLSPTAIDQLEADRVKITNVKTPGLWLSIAKILQIDPHRLVAMIRDALSGQQPEQRFTRMERGATAANRENFLSGAVSRGWKEDAADYIDRVRTELGLPSSPIDTIE